ncbi:MAG: PqqD family protein [Reyranella sp.]|jgi:hypothetical protein|uniref:PqqD family protein n=1 Tax=Reyranella sp. TaxID=1929291 RepID=UPI0025F99D9C|nr:PqqD family protein [Reyranella sp.]MBR2813854.1 PqqD family protein [Reyranella sp.]
MLDLSTVVKKSAAQVSCVLNEEVAVLNVERALYFGLQGVGAFVWDRLEEPSTVAALCEAVLEEFDVPPEVCRRDVMAFLDSLSEAGLVDFVSA